MLTTKQFKEYTAALGRHDWTYAFSDDHSVWRAGLDNEKLLRYQASTDSLLMRALLVWEAYQRTPRSHNDAAHRDAELDLIYQTVAEEQSA